MPLNYKVKDLTTVPEAQRTLYRQTAENGFFYLDTDGAADAEAFNEFRGNNRKLMRLLGTDKIDDAVTKLTALAEIDPEKHAKLVADMKKFTDPAGKLIDVDGLVTARTEEMRGTHTREKTKLESDNKALKARLETILIDDSLATAAAKKGILPSALEDVKLRGRSVFKMDGDDIKPFAPDGQSIIYGPSGTKPMTMDEWIDKLAASAPHLFETNSGGGSRGTGTGARTTGYTQPNPYSTKSLNRTEQARLEKTNPALAQQLQQTAEK